jgi:hypothetical protein
MLSTQNLPQPAPSGSRPGNPISVLERTSLCQKAVPYLLAAHWGDAIHEKTSFASVVLMSYSQPSKYPEILSNPKVQGFWKFEQVFTQSQERTQLKKFKPSKLLPLDIFE